MPGEDAFDDELPEYFTRQKHRNAAAVLSFRLVRLDEFDERREAVAGIVRIAAEPFKNDWRTALCAPDHTERNAEGLKQMVFGDAQQFELVA